MIVFYLRPKKRKVDAGLLDGDDAPISGPDSHRNTRQSLTGKYLRGSVETDRSAEFSFEV